MSAFGKADGAQAVGNAGLLHQVDDCLRQQFAGLLIRRAGRVDAHQAGGVQMLGGIRRGGETEDRRRVEDNRHPVGNDWMIGRVSRRSVTADHTADRVAHAVGQMHAGVAETDAGVGCGQEHGAAGIVVFRILYRAHKVG